MSKKRFVESVMETSGNMDQRAFTTEQGNRAQKLFAAVVLAALDDAIQEDRRTGNGVVQITRWARSLDGREVLLCAGINPTERAIQGMVKFVEQGQRTSIALSREDNARRQKTARAA